MIKQQIKFVKCARLVGLLTAACASVIASTSEASDRYIDQGHVTSVTPRLEQVTVPRQICDTTYQEQVIQTRRPSVAGSVIGGIAGGLLGSTVGRGNGRVAMAAVGAGLGAVVGDRISQLHETNQRQVRMVPVETCREVADVRTIESGYDVTYQYNGREYRTVTMQHPGDTIEVDVSVLPRLPLASVQNQMNRIEYRDPWQGKSRDQRRRHYHDRQYY